MRSCRGTDWTWEWQTISDSGLGAPREDAQWVRSIQNTQLGRFHSKILLKTQQFFFGYSFTGKKRYIKKTWQGLSAKGYPYWKRSWGHDEKSCFVVLIWKHKFFIMTPWPFLIRTSVHWKLLPCSFQKRYFYHGFCLQGKAMVLMPSHSLIDSLIDSLTSNWRDKNKLVPDQTRPWTPKIFTDSEPPKKCRLGGLTRCAPHPPNPPYWGGQRFLFWGLWLMDHSDPNRVKHFWKLLTSNIISVILGASP